MKYYCWGIYVEYGVRNTFSSSTARWATTQLALDNALHTMNVDVLDQYQDAEYAFIHIFETDQIIDHYDVHERKLVSTYLTRITKSDIAKTLEEIAEWLGDDGDVELVGSIYWVRFKHEGHDHTSIHDMYDAMKYLRNTWPEAKIAIQHHSIKWDHPG
jgi:hypothetical protein